MEGIISKITNTAKGWFLKEDGSLKWANVIALAAGAAVGGVFMDLGIVGALVGAGLGLGGSEIVGSMMQTRQQSSTPAPVAGTQPSAASADAQQPVVPPQGIPQNQRVPAGRG